MENPLRDPRDLESLFIDLLPQIERIVAVVCRRHGRRGAEAEDFLGEVRLKLIADRYAVLRKFNGKSKLSTYLTSVIANLSRDELIRRSGKWHASKKAKDLGTSAVRLEELVVREGRRFDEAIELLVRNEGVEETVEELQQIAEKLPPRVRRRFESEESLASLHAPEDADHEVCQREAAVYRARLRSDLEAALATLPTEEDRVLVRLHLRDGVKIAQVARMLNLEQRPLYRRVQRLKEALRQTLEAQGWTSR